MKQHRYQATDWSQILTPVRESGISGVISCFFELSCLELYMWGLLLSVSEDKIVKVIPRMVPFPMPLLVMDQRTSFSKWGICNMAIVTIIEGGYTP